MSLKKRQIDGMFQRVLAWHDREANAANRLERTYAWTVRWLLMLQRKFIADDVKVRAESLSYLMLVSILPLIAGFFFFMTIFTRLGLVQEALQSFVDNLLSTVPEEHRAFINDYTVKFKDAYLETLSGKSSQLGIFALLILFWVGLSTFSNIDATINHIWGSDHARRWLEKIRNFIVTSVGAPFALISALSVPLILRKIPATARLLETFPVVLTLMNIFIPILVIFATFTMLYKFVPVTRVTWRSALYGGAFSAVLLQIANMGMNLYFRIGTNTAYGKAAILPLIAFWIYVGWIIVILGAEVSYLVQNERVLLLRLLPSPTIHEVEARLSILARLQSSFDAGSGPVAFDTLLGFSKLNPALLRDLLHELIARNDVLLVDDGSDDEDSKYGLARSMRERRVADELRAILFENRQGVESSEVGGAFMHSLESWLSSYKDTTFGDLVNAVKEKRQ